MVMKVPQSSRVTPHRAAVLIGLLAGALPVVAEEGCTEDAIVVFDGSGSMAEMGFNDMDEPRIFEARRAVADAIPEIAQNRRIGLMIYGPNGEDACSGIDLRFPPIRDAAPRVIGEVNALQPEGETPLTEAVKEAVSVLEAFSGTGTVVLVTDGKETCGGAPCQLAAELSASGFTVHVIGYKVRGEYFAWSSEENNEYENAVSVSSCLAERTGGLYVGAETVDELIAAFHKTLGCRLAF